MKKTIIMMIVTVMATLTAVADTTYESLSFSRKDGTVVSYGVDGLKITFSNSNAVIRNNETTGTLALNTLDYMYFSDAATSSVTGDVNADGEISVADVNAIIDIILGAEADDDTRERADVNGDDEITVADVNAVIDLILAQ